MKKSELRRITAALNNKIHISPPISLFKDDDGMALRSVKFAISAIEATPIDKLAQYLMIKFGKYLEGKITAEDFIKIIQDDE